MTQKVFGIGFQKTGTRSLGIALPMLGYRICTWRDTQSFHINPGPPTKENLAALDPFDAFTDGAYWYPDWYKHLDRAYPGSKFILTIRSNEDVWFDSLKRWYARKFNNKHPFPKVWEWIYGEHTITPYNKQAFKNAYLKHNQQVIEYFKDRPNDLLVIDFSQGNEWDKICSFLGKEVPKKPFPHVNKTKSAIDK